MSIFSTKPVIGILGNILITPGGVSTVKRNFTNDACVQAIASNGGIPIILPFTEDPSVQDLIFTLCDGMLFPGGQDIDPNYYGEKPHEKLGEVNRAVDEFWFRAAHYAIEHRLAILGICRGMQLLNVTFGGTLYQDLSERGHSLNHLQCEPRCHTSQKVYIEPNTHLCQVIGEAVVPVNSMHHQAVKEPAKSFIISAYAQDGVIEGIESLDRLVLAVQWHPEDLIESVPIMNKLFQDLVDRARLSQETDLK